MCKNANWFPFFRITNSTTVYVHKSVDPGNIYGLSRLVLFFAEDKREVNQ